MNSRRRFGGGMVALALAGLAISAYLTAVKVAGELPVCGPVVGCETVALSEYSQILGLPTALLGAGLSGLLVVVAAAWWRTGDGRVLLATYGLGFVGVLVVGWLTYLELFVIEAVCIWCVAYAVTIVGGFVVAAVALRGSEPE